MLDEHSPIPLYYQLRNVLEERIDNGTYKPGEKIPSENALCGEFGISRTTVRQAINDLVISNRLERTQGRGTFVTDPWLKKPLYKISGFTSDINDMGQKPFSKTLEKTIILPPTEVKEALHMKEKEVVIFLKRLRFIGELVVGLDDCYYPFNRFSGFMEEDFEKNSLYQLLMTKYGTIPTSSLFRIESILCPPDLCSHLDLTPADPIFFGTEAVSDQNGQVFEFTYQNYRSDRFTFHFEIDKAGAGGMKEKLTGIPKQLS